MKKVLLPTDFSENAYNAIKYAVQVLQKEKCKFYLLNTYTPVLYDPEYLMFNVSQPNLYDIFRKNSEDNLKRTQQRIQKDFPKLQHEFESISSFNTLNEEVKDQVANKQIDVIIMGTKGATGAKEILFGSNTVQVMNKSNCPVLAIPEHFEFSRISNILFPTDFNLKYEEKHLKLLKEFTQMQGAFLNVLHISKNTELENIQEQNKNLLQEKILGLPHRFHHRENSSVRKGIFKFQEEHAIDLLTMINNKHSFFENLLFTPKVNEIGFHIKVPFLVIPS